MNDYLRSHPSGFSFTCGFATFLKWQFQIFFWPGQKILNLKWINCKPYELLCSCSDFIFALEYIKKNLTLLLCLDLKICWGWQAGKNTIIKVEVEYGHIFKVQWKCQETKTFFKNWLDTLKKKRTHEILFRFNFNSDCSTFHTNTSKCLLITSQLCPASLCFHLL